jgi:cytochrome b involved in lipid metabolism
MPLDAYHNDIFEVIIVSLLTCMLPLLFKESMFEYFFIIAILYLHSTYLHSEVKSNFIIPFFNNTVFHNLHHKIGKGNYSIFFTFWDDYMKTRLNTTYIKEETELATMTMDEFKEECKKGKKLTIISNSIVNCETWINDHPGGKSAIEELIGKDSTESFMKIHGNSNFANEMLKTLTIAKLNAI